MFVRFWGTRGSIPAPGPHTAVYGGNTSCVEVRAHDGTLIILDCGSGIRELGLHLLRTGRQLERIYLLIGHTHWDHIQGFPFFTPAFLPGIEMNIFAPVGFQRSLEDSLAGQMQYSYFPVKLQDLSSRIHYTELEEGFFRIGDVLVETQYLNHTTPTVAYRLTSGGASLAYVTDHEPFWNSPGPAFHHPGDQGHLAFLKGVDMVIHDAQYSEEEYKTKKGWGHSTIRYATDIAAAAGAARLALFHHDPTHNDDTLRGFEEYAQARALAIGSPLQVFAAAEGMELELAGKAVAREVSEESAREVRRITGKCVMVVSDNQEDIDAIERVLSEEGLIVTAAGNGRTAVERAPQIRPDLVILNSKLADGIGASFIQSIRSALGNSELPVLLLTEDHESHETLYSAESIATDYVARPFSPPMLRTRVRVWLARSMTSVFESSPIDALHDNEAGRIPIDVESDTGYADLVPSGDLFRSLTSPQLKELLTQAVRRVFPRGHSIFRDGEPGSNVHVILSGRVRVVETLPDSSAEMLLGELGQGELFGEFGILRERPRPAAFITLESTTCLLIRQDNFLKALNASPEMAMTLLRVLGGRLYQSDRLLAQYVPDPLTGLPGRRAFYDLYKRLTVGARRRGKSVVLVALDVVNLRSINDEFGYAVGDDVLRAVGDALQDSSRGTDLVARYGGDEFAALLLEASADNAEAVVERIHEKLRQMTTLRGLPPSVAFRIGYAVNATPPSSVDELLRAADLDMQSKRLGTPSNS